ncbi:MAG: DUF1295 domain-containing protein [Cyclobacteriaceae bacterium]
MMANNFIPLFEYGGATLLIVFAATWLIQLRTKNAAIVDSVWAVSFPLLALIYCTQSNTFEFRKGILLVMVLVWGMRLAAYLFVRTINHKEDVRYTELRNKWGKHQNILMLRFYLVQALLALILSYPFAIVMVSPQKEMNSIEWFSFIIWIVAVVGESLADAQLKNFKSNPANKGKICQDGLWNYSRHPNYFFEWLVWVSYFLFAVTVPFGWISIISPMLILYFLLKVTGIPYTEQQMIKSRGQDFIEYQKNTSSFFPLPKRRKN